MTTVEALLEAKAGPTGDEPLPTVGLTALLLAPFSATVVVSASGSNTRQMSRWSPSSPTRPLGGEEESISRRDCVERHPDVVLERRLAAPPRRPPR